MNSKLRCFTLVSCLLGMLSCAGAPVAAPRGVDYSAAISELRTFITAEMDRLGMPCLGIALVDGSRIVWEEGFGWQDAEQGIRASEAGNRGRIVVSGDVESDSRAESLRLSKGAGKPIIRVR
jgi:hypothetical protein